MLTCPSCGQENPEGARFCNACGTTLTAAHTTRKERKFATALFADLVGSTALAEREDPEVVQSVIGRTFDRMAEEIGRHEGLLEKFMGDASWPSSASLVRTRTTPSAPYAQPSRCRRSSPS